MNIRKLFIRESLLFIIYMGFGFLIFPAGLVAIYILIGGASKDISFAGELVDFYKSCMVPSELMDKLRQINFFGLNIPAAYGGLV